MDGSEVIQNLEMMVSALNLEIQKCKLEHKKEKAKIESATQATIDQLQKQLQADRVAMKIMEEGTTAKIQEQKAKIESQEEYLDAYRSQIQELEEQMAKAYYQLDLQKKSSPVRASTNEENGPLSPLNFNRLAFGDD